MSMNVGMMACYDQAKEVIAKLTGDPMTNGPNLATRMSASATAGFTAALFSMPFDLVKSRLMAQKPDPMTGELPYKVRRIMIDFWECRHAPSVLVLCGNSSSIHD
jgi:solute carrier family 25 oxoglutarate transporter 11